jgi:hypothetical protein
MSCAAANFCIDALGRALLQVLVRKTEISTVALRRPAEGLLVGQAGISQAAMSALQKVQNITRYEVVFGRSLTILLGKMVRLPFLWYGSHFPK